MNGSTMTAVTFDDVVEQYHQAVAEFIKGNAEPETQVFSNRDDVSLSNPVGPTALGWEEVSARLVEAAAMTSGGEGLTFENLVTHATPELGFTVDVQRCTARVTGIQEMVPISLRVTTIFRLEDGTWKVVHRHADPITSARPVESVIQR
jgi:ketosteroid isomerase-like protein